MRYIRIIIHNWVAAIHHIYIRMYGVEIMTINYRAKIILNAYMIMCVMCNAKLGIGHLYYIIMCSYDYLISFVAAYNIIVPQPHCMWCICTA